MPLNLTRSLLTIMLPGLVALGPWLLLVMVWHPDLNRLYKGFTVPFHVAAFGLVVVVGCMFEEVGSYLEKRWDRAISSEEEPSFEETWVNQGWYIYLSKAYTDEEPVAYRYLSRKVTALYFELGMMCAVPVALVAVALLVPAVLPGATPFAFVIGVIAAMAPIALWVSAKHTHQLLCEVRHFVANPPDSIVSRIAS